MEWTKAMDPKVEQSLFLVSFSHIHTQRNTVNPGYNDHPWDPKIVVVVDRWSLLRGHLCYKSSNKGSQNGSRYRQLVAVWRWSLTQVCLYTQIHNRLYFTVTLYFTFQELLNEKSFRNCVVMFWMSNLLLSLPFKLSWKLNIELVYINKSFEMKFIKYLMYVTTKQKFRCHVEMSGFKSYE